MTNILVIERSAVLQRSLMAILSSVPVNKLSVAICEPEQADRDVIATEPDVLIIGIDPPYADSLSMIGMLIEKHAVPIIAVSSMDAGGMKATVQALEMGVVDFIGKPTLDMQRGYLNIVKGIMSKLSFAAQANINSIYEVSNSGADSGKSRNLSPPTNRIVGIGASIGGVFAIKTILSKLPADSPPVLISLDLPAGLTKILANRLNQSSDLLIREAEDSQIIAAGHAYIAPGNHHLRLDNDGSGYICHLSSDPPVEGSRPSIDVMFYSMARVAGADCIGIILSGAGRDGVNGLLAMQNVGGLTIGQDQKSALVFDKPKIAIEQGACHASKNISNIISTIVHNFD